MAITLGGVDLPDLLIENEFGFPGVDSRVEFSLGGTPIIWEQEMTGKPIDLRGTTDTGWITRSVLQSLYALAAVPGATYTLDYEGTIYTVRFRNEDRPVLAAKPAVGRPNQDTTDYYSDVSIKLMEV